MCAEFLVKKACDDANAFFGSEAFRSALDGHMAEEYFDLSKRAASEAKRIKTVPQPDAPADGEKPRR